MKCTDNQLIIEEHPLVSFLPSGAQLLMLGSFPPPMAKWSMNFYYPNYQNDMWRIMGLVFYGNKEYFLIPDKKLFCEERIRAFLTEKGIAITDTAKEVFRRKDNASDKYLEVVGTINPEEVLKQLPHCKAVVTTGQKATDTLLSVVDAGEPGVGEYTEFMVYGRLLRLYRMPSSSRAYPRPLEEKAAVYGEMFRQLGLL